MTRTISLRLSLALTVLVGLALPLRADANLIANYRAQVRGKYAKWRRSNTRLAAVVRALQDPEILNPSIESFNIRISPKTGKAVTVGVMGGDGSEKAMQDAETFGRLLGEQGVVLVNGGSNRGVMKYVSRGARKARGLVLGVLAGKRNSSADGVNLEVATAMGSARNIATGGTPHVQVVMSGSYGTLTEAAFARKYGAPVIALNHPNLADGLKMAVPKGADGVFKTETPEQTLELTIKLLKKEGHWVDTPTPAVARAPMKEWFR